MYDIFPFQQSQYCLGWYSDQSNVVPSAIFNWYCTINTQMNSSLPPGDYVLRDPAGGPRGMVRVMIRWKYPFHPSVGTLVDHQDAVMESSDRMDRRREKAEESQQPIAKPRIKVFWLDIVPHGTCNVRNVILKILSLLLCDHHRHNYLKDKQKQCKKRQNLRWVRFKKTVNEVRKQHKAFRDHLRWKP